MLDTRYKLMAWFKNHYVTLHLSRLTLTWPGWPQIFFLLLSWALWGVSELHMWVRSSPWFRHTVNIGRFWKSRGFLVVSLARQMGDRRGRLKRQSARVSGQGWQNLYSKLQFLRDFWWLFLWFGDSFRSKLSNYFVFCTKVMFLFTSIFYPNFYPLLPSRFVLIRWS